MPGVEMVFCEVGLHIRIPSKVDLQVRYNENFTKRQDRRIRMEKIG